jgi:hypothetical protein
LEYYIKTVIALWLAPWLRPPAKPKPVDPQEPAADDE